MLSELRDGRAGTAVLPGDAEWGENPPIYPPAGEPGAVVRPETPEQVAAALRTAADEGVGVVVRSGGHGGGAFESSGVIVIELSRFTGIEVDGSRVQIGAGAVWGDVATALAPHGLALSSGDTKSVGVGGLTLGGGVGWMVREHGLAIDSLVEAEVVLPSGDIVTASTSENSELFWALRGGGGNFGVVTTFVFEAHPLDGVVFGTLDVDPAELPAALRGWRDVMRTAPEQFESTFLAMPAMGPEMPAGVQIIVLHPGRHLSAVEPVLARLRALPGYRSEDLGVREYHDALDDAHPFEGDPPTIVGANGFAADFDDDLVGTVVGVHEAMGGVLMVRYLRGAYNRVPADATAWAHRDAEVMIMCAAFLPPHAPQSDVAGMLTTWDPLLTRTTGTYGNFVQRVGDDVTALMYPPATLARLRRVKRTYDPQNLLRRNHNVAP